MGRADNSHRRSGIGPPIKTSPTASTMERDSHKRRWAATKPVHCSVKEKGIAAESINHETGVDGRPPRTGNVKR